MFTVNAVFDGRNFRFERPLPVEEAYEAVITFTNPAKKTQESVLQYFDNQDEDDAQCIAEIIRER